MIPLQVAAPTPLTAASVIGVVVSLSACLAISMPTITDSLNLTAKMTMATMIMEASMATTGRMPWKTGSQNLSVNKTTDQSTFRTIIAMMAGTATPMAGIMGKMVEITDAMNGMVGRMVGTTVGTAVEMVEATATLMAEPTGRMFQRVLTNEVNT